MNMLNLFPNPVTKSASLDPTDQQQGSKRMLSAAAASDNYSCEFGSTKYFALCGFGGILSCGITHTMVTPLDLVKCRLQVGIYWILKRKYT